MADGDLITLAQLAARLGRPLDDDEIGTQAPALIEDASALARDVIANDTITSTWTAAEPGTVPPAVIPVVVAMVRRGMDNPHGYQAEGQQAYYYQGSTGVGVFATPQEAATLRRAARVGSPRSIDLTAGLPVRRFYSSGGSL